MDDRRKSDRRKSDQLVEIDRRLCERRKTMVAEAMRPNVKQTEKRL